MLSTYLRLAGDEGMEKNMETTIMGYIGLGFRRDENGNGNYCKGLPRDYYQDHS